MKVLLIGLLAIGSFTAFAQTFHYSNPQIEGADNQRGLKAYITSNSDLDTVCQILSGGSSSTYASSRKTKKIDIGENDSPYFKNLVRIKKNNHYPKWLMKDSVVSGDGVRKFTDESLIRDYRIISKLECEVVGVWSTVHITDNTSGRRNDSEKNATEQVVKETPNIIVREISQPSMSSSLSCGGNKSYTYGWGGQRYDSSERSNCLEAKNEAINNCLYSEGESGSNACKSNVSSCLTNPCTTIFIGRTYGWGGQSYESPIRTTCAQGKQEAINNCLYQEGSRGTAACKENASCVELLGN